MSFDTSLIDVQKSFSSTETNTSGSSTQENIRPPDKPRESSPYRTIPTNQLYEQWASTYDTDGNVLQAVDDIQLRHLLPKFARLTCRNRKSAKTGPLKILDLGCGTGRNTLKLLQAEWDTEIDVFGWDASRSMLEIAKTKCNPAQWTGPTKITLNFDVRDLASVDSVPNQYSNFFDGLISTLVLEHIPAKAFFDIIAKVLKRHCYALITNMHNDMGALSRAGFKTASGERFKATSYIHTPQETVDAANATGLAVVGDVEEIEADGNLIDGGMVNGVMVEKGMVAERARKWVGTKVWYGMMLRKE